jgi:hypothetical protein
MKNKLPKKHELILKEIDRMSEADTRHCMINSCKANDFMMGKSSVYQDLTKFINRLNEK